MMVTKCNICKKMIKDKPIIAGIGFFNKVELCGKCGSPVMEFLKSNNLIEVKRKK